MSILFRYLSAMSFLVLLLIGGGAVAQTNPSQAGPPQTVRDWFQRYDRNGDGKIDREEFQQGVVEAFYFRDKNKSGYLTVEELQGASPEAVKAASRSRDGRLSLDEYVNALFKDFEAMDTDGDGKLTLEEIDIYVHNTSR